MWFQLTIINNNDLLHNHMDGLVILLKTEYYYLKASGMEGVKEFTSNLKSVILQSCLSKYKSPIVNSVWAAGIILGWRERETNPISQVHILFRCADWPGLAWEPDDLQGHVLFALAHASGPPPVQTDFQPTWPTLGLSQPFI